MKTYEEIPDEKQCANNKKMTMSAIKYSKEEFEGYTHRFIIEVATKNSHVISGALTIYSDCGDFENLKQFLNDKKSEKVKSFEIIHRASKEQDEASGRLVNEFLNTEIIFP